MVSFSREIYHWVLGGFTVSMSYGLTTGTGQRQMIASHTHILLVCVRISSDHMLALTDRRSWTGLRGPCWSLFFCSWLTNTATAAPSKSKPFCHNYQY